MNTPKKENNAENAVITYEDVLNAVQHGQNPSKIANQVRLFLQQNQNLSGAAKTAIANAVYERNKLERQKGNPGAKRMRLDVGYNLRERPWLQLNIGNTNPAADNANFVALLKTRPVDVLKWICLSRQSLNKMERACGGSMKPLRKLLANCLVRVSVNGENLVDEIRNVEDSVQFNSRKRRLFLPQLGYFEFHQISDSPPTPAEIQRWIQRHRLPEVNFLRNKIAKLNSILGNQHIQIQVEADGSALDLDEALAAEQPGGEGTSSAGRKRKRKAKRNPANEDVSEIVHSLDTLVQSLLPNELFLRFLAVRNKFAERATATHRCLVAYRILGDPTNKVRIDQIAQVIGSSSSVKFKHRRTPVKFANLLPVVEERDVDEDVYGEWLEDMVENWNEPLPLLQTLMEAKTKAMDMIKQTVPRRIGANAGATIKVEQ